MSHPPNNHYPGGWELPNSTAEDQQESLSRVDSPIDGRMSSSSEEPIVDGDRNLPVRGRSSAPQDGSSSASNQEAGFKFVNVGHPNQLKNKEAMQGIRSHVMHTYLDKERQKPSSTDARVKRASNSRKRPRLDFPSPNAQRRSASSENTLAAESSHSNAHSLPRPAHGQRSFSNQPSATAASLADATEPEIDYGVLPPHSSRRRMVSEELSPLVKAISSFENSPYLLTPFDGIGDTRLGSALQPFDTWPSLEDPRLNTQALKWSCSRRFGSQGIVSHWVPTLLQAKHAFLSTICISSAHDDIMMRGRKPLGERSQHESFERMRVRIEVISLINDAMQDPKQRTADATIVAVLHLLNSEVMGCDDSVMKTHQDGLHDMVRQRGGLGTLGVDGQLASILTITMYLISALRETLPHSDFREYAAKERETSPPQDSLKVPESPVYCSRAGFYTLSRALRHVAPVYHLLNDLRLLTAAFVRRASSAQINTTAAKMSFHSTGEEIWVLHDKIFALPSGEELHEDLGGMHERYTYEALRLVGRVFAYALAHEIPFSKAGLALSEPSDNDRDESQRGTPMHIQIKTALGRTNLSDCWGPLAGVLFWVTILAGACANPDSAHQRDHGEMQARGPDGRLLSADAQDAEDARKWLAAVAVRCSIVLSFEYGSAMLETLRRIVGIEQALANAEEARSENPEMQQRRPPPRQQSQPSPPRQQSQPPPPPRPQQPQQQQTPRSTPSPLLQRQRSQNAGGPEQKASPAPVATTTASAPTYRTAAFTAYGPQTSFATQLGFQDFALDFEGV